MPQIRVSKAASDELKRRAEEQRRTITAVVDLMIEQTDETKAEAS